MLTIGIHDGHTATAAILEDGRILACLSEERLNRQKEWEGFPELSIKECLKIAGKSPNQFDTTGFCSLMPQIGHGTYLQPLWTKRIFGEAVKMLPSSLLQKEANIRYVQTIGWKVSARRRQDLIGQVRALGFACPVRFYEHHHLHAATGYYMNWYRPDPCLVITLDGSGDGVCASINIGEKGKLTRIKGIFNYNSICEFYTKITQYLGMKPMSHEYKIMGMAPYADEKYRADLLGIFRTFYRISDQDPLEFINTSGRWKWQFLDLFKELLFQKRFDNISGAVQDLFEEVVLAWIRNTIEKTGIHDLALSGGGFMNVKLNGKILDLPEVNSLFVFPSCGDESNPMGAAILAALDNGYDYKHVETLKMIYWGPQFSNTDVKKVIDNEVLQGSFNISFQENIDSFVAKKLAAGQIIGRLTGRMEWGARALGNRSIIADPRSTKVIQRINKAIKMRDFWMPFAPAILKNYQKKYLKLRDDFHCPFMTMACKTTPQAFQDIAAGLHPFDLTARPQIVDPDNHPSFYKLISEFEKETGVGGVLNTSFNLHGEPVVCSPEDAIHTLINSDLDAIQLENYYVERIR